MTEETLEQKIESLRNRKMSDLMDVGSAMADMCDIIDAQAEALRQKESDDYVPPLTNRFRLNAMKQVIDLQDELRQRDLLLERAREALEIAQGGLLSVDFSGYYTVADQTAIELSLDAVAETLAALETKQAEG